MTVLQAIILGAVQGVTEFLPVSSSGHLVIMKELFRLSEVPVLFDVLLHVSTLVVVVIVFRKLAGSLLASLGRWIVRRTRDGDKQNMKIILLIIIASAITAAVGYAVSLLHVERVPRVVALLFIVTAVILIGTRFIRGKKEYDKIGLQEGIITGFAQGLGVLPGISRAGIVISSALYSGMSREKAGEFSFIISIPAILGALVLSLRDAETLTRMVSPLSLAAGIAASFIVGLFSILLLLWLVRKGKLFYFAFYLIPLGIVSFILI